MGDGSRMQSNAGSAAIDVYDISRRVERVMAQSPLLPWPLDGYTNGTSFFFTDAQVVSIADALPSGQVARSAAGGWKEVTGAHGTRVLAERRINDGSYFRFRRHWNFQAISAGH